MRHDSSKNMPTKKIYLFIYGFCFIFDPMLGTNAKKRPESHSCKTIYYCFAQLNARMRSYKIKYLDMLLNNKIIF